MTDAVRKMIQSGNKAGLRNMAVAGGKASAYARGNKQILKEEGERRMAEHFKTKDYNHMMTGDDIEKMAFLDELEKIGMDLATATSAVNAIKRSGKLIRRGINPEMTQNVGLVAPAPSLRIDINPRKTGIMAAVSGRNSIKPGTEAIIPKEIMDAATAKTKTNVANKIYQPGGGMIRQFHNMARQSGNKDIVATIKSMSPKEKEMANRIGIIHESHELGVTNRTANPISSHLSTNVIARENNAIHSLPSGFDNTAKLFSQVRSAEGVSSAMAIPYGTHRISKPYQAAIVKRAELGKLAKPTRRDVMMIGHTAAAAGAIAAGIHAHNALKRNEWKRATPVETMQW